MLPRERFSLIWAASLVVVFAAYFTFVATMPGYSDLPILQKITMLAAALTTLAMVAIGTHIFTRAGRIHAEELIADERDRLIEGRATTAAYYTLMAGMIVVGVVMPFEKSGWDIVNAALLAIAAAEIVHSCVVLIGYRRGLRA
jgi:hypothetical protein